MRGAGLERSKSALAVMLRLVRAVMTGGVVAREALIDGRAWRDGEYATFWRGHPPGRNKRAQEYSRRKKCKDRELRPADHRRPLFGNARGFQCARSVRNQLAARSLTDISR